ncbi:MAG: exo-alpha-sialidase, partial [Gaiellaceae bacterium]
MSRTVLMVGTRKGAFLIESENRRDWTMRGPYCEGWPVYHAIYDANSGSIYAAAASEWHGSAIWRSRDVGSTWELSSEGLSYGDDGDRKVSKVSTLAVAGDRLLVGVEAPGIFESRDGGETFTLLSTLAGQPGSEAWDD